jgi:hypothetical protein
LSTIPPKFRKVESPEYGDGWTISGPYNLRLGKMEQGLGMIFDVIVTTFTQLALLGTEPFI